MLQEDFDGRRFQLVAHPMPCCGGWFRICDLLVEAPDGVILHGADSPTTTQRRALEALAGCPVRIVAERENPDATG